MNQPGLDEDALRGMLARGPARAGASVASTRTHLATNAGYVAWSGGVDSTAALLLARETTPNVPVCFFDSGLEFPETLDYIARLGDAFRLNLHVIKAVPDALTVMAATGAWDHTAPAPRTEMPSLHEALVTVPARKAHALFGPGEVWGLRAGESGGRRALLAPGRGTVRRIDGTVAYSPVWDWRAQDVTGYLAYHEVPANPVYDRLRALGATGRDLRVGLVIDGNGLQHGRAVWVRHGWPELWERLVAVLPRLHEWS